MNSQLAKYLWRLSLLIITLTTKRKLMDDCISRNSVKQGCPSLWGRRLKCRESVERSNGSLLAEIGREAEWESVDRNQPRSRMGVDWSESVEYTFIFIYMYNS